MGMREHVRQAPTNTSQGYLLGIANKSHRYVAIIGGFNHSDVSRLWAKGSREQALKGSYCSGNEGDKLEQLERE
jgi:hypothetical protein